MRRWIWVCLALATIGIAASFALLPIGGSRNKDSALAQPPSDALLELDLVQDAGGSWCNPVDNAATHTQGDTYQVAVCVTDGPAPPGGFEFQVNYDDTLNDCVDAPVPPASAFDGNPDANLGTTTFDGSVEVTANGLGTGWDCNLSGIAPPVCANLEGHAFLKCNTIIGTTELPSGDGTSEPIAVLTFQATAGGIDNLTLLNAEIDDPNVEAYIDCFIHPEQCVGGTDTKLGTPTVTPTSTNTPVPPAATSTNTPVPPTATSTNTPVPPTPTSTNTPVAPTATSTSTPVGPTATSTNTPVPPTATSTNTPVPPTATSTNTPVPPTATSTNTPVPPTATSTNTPAPPTATSTNTPVPPTATNTPLAPTATNTPRPATATSTPSPQGLDLNGDGEVNGKDVAVVAKALFTHPGDRRWNPVADVNQDGRVNLMDLFLVIKGMQAFG